MLQKAKSTKTWVTDLDPIFLANYKVKGGAEREWFLPAPLPVSLAEKVEAPVKEGQGHLLPPSGTVAV